MKGLKLPKSSLSMRSHGEASTTICEPYEKPADRPKTGVMVRAFDRTRRSDAALDVVQGRHAFRPRALGWSGSHRGLQEGRAGAPFALRNDAGVSRVLRAEIAQGPAEPARVHFRLKDVKLR